MVLLEKRGGKPGPAGGRGCRSRHGCRSSRPPASSALRGGKQGSGGPLLPETKEAEPSPSIGRSHHPRPAPPQLAFPRGRCSWQRGVTVATLPFIQDLQATTLCGRCTTPRVHGRKSVHSSCSAQRGPRGRHGMARHGAARRQPLLVLQPTSKEPGLCPDPKKLPLGTRPSCRHKTCLALAQKTQQASGQ